MVGFLALFNIPDGFDDESNGFASSGRLGYRALGAGSYSGGHVSAYGRRWALGLVNTCAFFRWFRALDTGGVV